MTDHRTEAEIKAYNLHCALQSLLHHYKYIVDKTNSEPLFESDSDPDKVAGRALYDNMPLADWEPPLEYDYPDPQDRWEGRPEPPKFS